MAKFKMQAKQNFLKISAEIDCEPTDIRKSKDIDTKLISMKLMMKLMMKVIMIEKKLKILNKLIALFVEIQFLKINLVTSEIMTKLIEQLQCAVYYRDQT